MDLTQFAFGATMIIGIVNIVKSAMDQNWKSLVLSLAACIAGIVLGFLQWFGIPSAEIGLAIALASSGVYEVGQRVGGR